MSVICRELSKPHMVAYTKGAPEKLKTMCLPETIPPDFNEQLTNYTKKGYRVIAVAYKDLLPTFNWKMAQKAKREVVSIISENIVGKLYILTCLIIFFFFR